MQKITVSFLVVCLISSSLFAGFGRVGAAQEAQGQDEEQWQLPKSRDFGDDIFTKKRQPAKTKHTARQQAKRRKYQRIWVASSSANAIKYQKPSAVSVVSAPAQRRPPAIATPIKQTLDWQEVVPDSSGQVGVTIWRLRPCSGAGGGQSCFLKFKDADRTVMYEALRVSTDSDFRVGDGIQLAVESPVKGFIYVVHQEVYPDRQTGPPKLLYPLSEGGNAVGPGRPLLIPAQVEGGRIKVLKMENKQGKNLVGERLKIIITRRPVDGLFVQDKARNISLGDVQLWESQWSGRLELFDLEGNDKENMSLNEWLAMQRRNDGGRDLTTADLAPQKLYMVERKRNDGVLITLDLPYGG